MLCEQLSQKLHPDTVRVLARWEPLLLSFSLASSCYGWNTITTPSFAWWMLDSWQWVARIQNRMLSDVDTDKPMSYLHSFHSMRQGWEQMLTTAVHTLRSPVPVIWSAWTWVFMTYRSFSPSSFTRMASLSAVLSTGSTNCNPRNQLEMSQTSMPWGLASKIQAARRVYLDMRRTTPLISSKQHSGPKILAPAAETRQSEIHQICAQESPFLSFSNLHQSGHWSAFPLSPSTSSIRSCIPSHSIKAYNSRLTAIATYQSISHSQQRNEK
jgi:hypothetical protein